MMTGIFSIQSIPTLPINKLGKDIILGTEEKDFLKRPIHGISLI
jgi:hypothetical protein